MSDVTPRGAVQVMPAVPVLNVANGLTVARLVLAVVLCVLLLRGGAGWWPLGIFLAAALTDLADGYVARSWGLTTSFGIVADPIADKVLTLGALGCLSLLGAVPWWVTGLIALREGLITLIRLVAMKGRDKAAKWYGKGKTLALFVAIALYLVPPGFPLVAALAYIGMMIALACTMASLAGYLYQLRTGT